MSGAIAHFRRSMAFGWHVPVHKIARRLELNLRRRIRDRWQAASAIEPGVPIAADPEPPQPLFAPRPIPPAFDHASRCMTFLNRSIAMSGQRLVDWDAPVAPPDGQLWRMKLHEMSYLEQLPDHLLTDLIDDWIFRNPVTKPGSWQDAWNSYSVSIRTVVWMQEMTQRHGRLDAPFIARTEISLAQQLRFLRHNLETDIGGNHLIKNIRALIWGSAFFTGPEADHWRHTALDLLRAELPVQVLDDGMHFERSPSYHCQVFADLLECRHVLRNDPLDGLLDDALHRMAQVTADLTHPDGSVAQFNDAGLNMALPSHICLETYERLFATRPEPRAIFALPAAGLFGLNSAGTCFIADCGRIAPDDLPAHGHGDVLSFEWSVSGQRIFVDQGVFQYSAGPRRQSARAAASHNTLCFTGADQADFFSAFRCGRRPNVAVRAWRPGADGFALEGSHDGFRHLPGSPVHVRRFEVGQSEITIHDRIEGDPRGDATVGFLLHPDIDVTLTKQRAILRCRGRQVHVSCTQPVICENAVWWPDLGHERQTKRLRITLPAGCRELRTTLRVVPHDGAVT